MPKLAFDALPAIGTVLMLDKQAYELTDTRPYQRADGNMTTLLVWRSICPKCGDEFEATSTMRGSPPRRRCHAHSGHSPISRRRKGGVRVQVIEA
jgi:hypothetical protein